MKNLYLVLCIRSLLIRIHYENELGYAKNVSWYLGMGLWPSGVGIELRSNGCDCEFETALGHQC